MPPDTRKETEVEDHHPACRCPQECGPRAKQRDHIVSLIDERLMALEPNDADVTDELHGRVMELRHLRRVIEALK